MGKKRKLKIHLQKEVKKWKKVIEDYDNGDIEDCNELMEAEAKLEILANVMDIMNWDL